MEHCFFLYFDPDRNSKRSISSLVSRFPGLQLDADGDKVESKNRNAVRRLRDEARANGFVVSMRVATTLEPKDALLGELGLPFAGWTERFRAKLQPGAFDFSKGCPRCGLGAVQVKPFFLGVRGMKCKGPFYQPDQTRRVIMRADIGKEMAAATSQPKCIRHLVTRDGASIKEWVEVVPTFTMPPLSAKSKGIVFKKDPCLACGRAPWAESDDTPARLVYSEAAIKAAQRHAVVEMFEPYWTVPEFNRKAQSFRNTYGMPLLLFNLEVIKILMKYIVPESASGNLRIEPVYAE